MLVQCLKCNKKFDKKNNQIKRSSNHFCSRSCAASYNNFKNPKRKYSKKCKNCNNLVKSKATYCINYWGQKQKTIDYKLSEVIYHKHHKSSAYALVRSRARVIANKHGWYKCSKCGYDKHIEIAHIKPISDFDLETRLSIINSLDNLIPLCPNCHWEFDHKK